MTPWQNRCRGSIDHAQPNHATGEEGDAGYAYTSLSQKSGGLGPIAVGRVQGPPPSPSLRSSTVSGSDTPERSPPDMVVRVVKPLQPGSSRRVRSWMSPIVPGHGPLCTSKHRLYPWRCLLWTIVLSNSSAPDTFNNSRLIRMGDSRVTENILLDEIR